MATSYYTNIDLKGNYIQNLATPSSDNDAANKSYVDSVARGLDIKQSVKAASTGALTLSGTQTVDGVSLVAEDRVLVKNQGTGFESDNGIYVVKSGAWVRSTDATVGTNATLSIGSFTFVEGGTTNKGKGYVYSDPNVWTVFSESTVLTAGTGITIGGTTISISSSWTGQTAITTLGTISSGTWNGSTIGVAYGGTGATTLTGYVKGNGTSAFTAGTSVPITDVSLRRLAASYTVPTGTNAQTISTTSLESTLRGTATVQLYDAAGNQVFADVTVGSSSVIINTVNNTGSTFNLTYIITV